MNKKVIISAGIIILVAIGLGVVAVWAYNSQSTVNNVVPNQQTSQSESRSQQSQATTVTDSSDCIITVEGARYNVTQLRGRHPGGDIFECGSDMTQTFRRQHGTSLRRLEPYKIP